MNSSPNNLNYNNTIKEEKKDLKKLNLENEKLNIRSSKINLKPFFLLNLYLEIKKWNIQFSKINFIRENPWPLILLNEDSKNNDLIQKLEKEYWIKSDIIIELFWILQAVWFIPWVWFEVSKESLKVFENEDKAFKYTQKLRVKNKSKEKEFISEINKFLIKLSNLWIISDYKKHDLDIKKLPNWLFREASLFDTNFSRFKTLKDYLDFLYLNINICDNFFGSDYINLLKETSWLPVDDIKWRETMRFSKDKFVSSLWSFKLEHNSQEIELLFRVFPWFCPAWIYFRLSLNLPDINNEIQNNNYIYIIWLYFEKIWKSIIPVIHTIQNSFHNIGFDEKWKILHVNEPISQDHKNKNISLLQEESTDDEKISKKKKNFKMEIIKSINKQITSGLDFWTELLALILDKIFSYWFDKIKIIDPEDNLWLKNHNINREEKTIQESMNSMYRLKAEALGWKKDIIRWWYIISYSWIINYLWRFPHITEKYNKLKKDIKWIWINIKWLESSIIKDSWISEKVLKELNSLVKKIDEILESLDSIKKRSGNIENFLEIYNEAISNEKFKVEDFSEGIKDPNQRKLFLKRINTLNNRSYNNALDISIEELKKANYSLESSISSLNKYTYKELEILKSKVNKILNFRY